MSELGSWNTKVIYDDELACAEIDVGDKIPTWMVTLGVALFCGAFWAGVYYLAARLAG